MKIPTNLQTHNTPLSTIWIDKQGILCSVAKKDIPITIDGLTNVYALITTLTKGQKMCTLTEMSNISHADKEMRDFASQENEKFTKAMALIAKNKFASLIGNLFLGFNKPSYPAKLFWIEQEAREWIKQYL